MAEAPEKQEEAAQLHLPGGRIVSLPLLRVRASHVCAAQHGATLRHAGAARGAAGVKPPAPSHAHRTRRARNLSTSACCTTGGPGGACLGPGRVGVPQGPSAPQFGPRPCRLPQDTNLPIDRPPRSTGLCTFDPGFTSTGARTHQAQRHGAARRCTARRSARPRAAPAGAALHGGRGLPHHTHRRRRTTPAVRQGPPSCPAPAPPLATPCPPPARPPSSRVLVIHHIHRRRRRAPAVPRLRHRVTRGAR